MDPKHFDILLVGGGLSGGLIALALARHRPDLSVAIVESGPAFGGNHTWSSFTSDLSPEGAELVAPIRAGSAPRKADGTIEALNKKRFPDYKMGQ